MKQVRDVLQLHSVMKLSMRRIEGATNVAKSTVSKIPRNYSGNIQVHLFMLISHV